MPESIATATAEQLRAELENIAVQCEAFGLRVAPHQIRRLAARLSGMAAVPWQPIETAPKDGRLIWAFNTHDVTRAPWQYECMWNGIEWYHGLGNAWPRRPPTHWRELPAAPELPHV
jgi:hypothetical protein